MTTLEMLKNLGWMLDTLRYLVDTEIRKQEEDMIIKKSEE